MKKTFEVLLSIFAGGSLGLIGLLANKGLAWMMFLTGTLVCMYYLGLLDD